MKTMSQLLFISMDGSQALYYDNDRPLAVWRPFEGDITPDLITYPEERLTEAEQMASRVHGQVFSFYILGEAHQ